MKSRFVLALVILAFSLDAGWCTTERYGAAQPHASPEEAVAAANVKNFGAVGDGVADDSAAIQAALSSAFSRIYVPGGTYRLNGILRIPSNKRLTLAPDALMVRGANSSAMLLNDANGRTGGFDANANIVVEGGSWDGNAPQFPAACTIIGFGHVSDVVIRDCSITRIPVWHGIELNATRRGRVERVAFRSCLNEALQLDTMNSSNAGVFPWFGPYDNTACEDILVEDCTFAEVVTAIGSHSAPPVSRLVIRRCVADSTSGIAIKPVLYSNWSLENCEFNDCLSVFSGTAAGFVLRNNRINSSRGVEIDLAGCSDGLVEGNTLVQARLGIVNAAASVVVRNNLFLPAVRPLAPRILLGLSLDRLTYRREDVSGTITADVKPVVVTTAFAGETPAVVDIDLADTVIFRVAVEGSSPLRFQWLKDGVPIPDSILSSLVIVSASPAAAGVYTVTVSNPGGIVTSAPVQLTISGQGGVSDVAARALTNFSIRATISNPENPLTAGFALSGADPKPLVVRAVGPGLASFGVKDALGDPRLAVFDHGGAQIAANDNWSRDLAPIFEKVGAFSLPADSRDAGVVVILPGGSATAQARGSSPGVVLLEFFDVAPGSGTRLINVSARGPVAGGDQVLIGGFSSTGKGVKRLLIRGIGPHLGAFGVSGVLSDPSIELYDSTGRLVSSNDNWSNDLAAVFASVGAFPLVLGSKDSAMVAPVVAGQGYTVVLRGVGDAVGEALIEIYELPGG